MLFKIPANLLRILPLLLLCFLTACATVQKPLTGLVPGREVETLQSSISISLKSGEHGSSGRGFLVFRYPDRFHLAVLSPFGLTVLEVFSDGETLTCVVPSRQTAYVGRIDQLPEGGAFRSFALLKWVVARQPQPDPADFGREIVAVNGDRIRYDKYGFMQRKVSPEGDVAQFANYSNVNGVAFPESLEIKSVGSTTRIVFDEPEINTPLETAALTPALEGLKVLPLSEFKGM